MKHVYKVYKQGNPYNAKFVIASSKKEAIEIAQKDFPEYNEAIVVED